MHGELVRPGGELIDVGRTHTWRSRKGELVGLELGIGELARPELELKHGELVRPEPQGELVRT